jgi:hypothetical protein
VNCVIALAYGVIADRLNSIIGGTGRKRPGRRCGDLEPSLGNGGTYGPNGLEYDLEADSRAHVDDEPDLGWTGHGRGCVLGRKYAGK